MEAVAAALLLYAVFPLWVAAGLADWACHRATKIERTAGLRENLLHWLLFAEIGVGIVVAALFEPSAAVVAIGLASFLVHELTVYGELRYVVGKRPVRPFEQMVHSFMEILPLVSLGLLCVMAKGDASLTVRSDWNVAYLFAAAGAVLVFNVLPLAEETWRCWGALRAPPASKNDYDYP